MHRRDGGRAKFPLLFDALTSLQHCLSLTMGEVSELGCGNSRNLQRTFLSKSAEVF